MKKIVAAAIAVSTAASTVSAATVHTVSAGDTMWKIAVAYQIGLDEIIGANPKISNPAMIYPGQKINIPETNEEVRRFEKEVIRLVNNIRKESGLSELSEDWQLSRVARYKSEDMRDNNYFSHTSPTYGTPFNMIKNFGISYKSAAENIARGQRTPEAVVNSWMNSSGHRANILGKSYTKIGVGYDKEKNIWTQMFIG